MPVRRSKVTRPPYVVAEVDIAGLLHEIAGIRKVVTLAQVTPKSVLLHKPLPLRAPRIEDAVAIGINRRRSPIERRHVAAIEWQIVVESVAAMVERGSLQFWLVIR